MNSTAIGMDVSKGTKALVITPGIAPMPESRTGATAN
jgi:hypothetical protein